MGKRYDHLWEEIISFQNLHLAFMKAARGKRSHVSEASFEFEMGENLLELQNQLRNGVYLPGIYTSFFIHDPKRRLISAAPFRDRVVHHALVNVLEPVYERMFIYDTYANRRKKGTHAALDRSTYYMRRFQYVLPLDICQFFPSIDHVILYEMLTRTIADECTLDLCTRIINSGQGVLKEEYEMHYFKGDNLFAAQRPRGLPIGNLTSQFWANVYLNGLDHFVKRTLKCRGYLRYVDDMLLFSDDKEQLHGWRYEIISHLAGLRLTIHENSAQARPVKIGLPFLGFQLFPDHRRLKRRKVIHARRRLKALAEGCHRGKVDPGKLRAGIVGWINHARHGDTWGLRKRILEEIYQ